MPAIVGWGVQTPSQTLSRKDTFVAGAPALPGADAREVVAVSVPGESVPSGLPVTSLLERGFTVPLCVQPGSAQHCSQRLLQHWPRAGGLHVCCRGGDPGNASRSCPGEPPAALSGLIWVDVFQQR